MKPVFLILIVNLIFFSGYGQESCASADYKKNVLKNVPQLTRSLGVSNTDPLLALKLSQLTGVIHIPVVVHVLWNKDEENIPDSVIFAQIEHLNQDFSGTNADTSLVPSCFKNVRADCRIRFTLLQEDIMRKKTRVIKFMCKYHDSVAHRNDPIKFDSEGGQNGRASTQYLNIWIGNITNGVFEKQLLGYGTYPAIIGAYDGVVLYYKAVGPNKLNVYYNRGRTLTHEVGHWLNLNHIWGDRPCGDDFVDDTPPQPGASNGLPVFPLLSSCDTSHNGCMFMNFMDYTYDEGMHMFTVGQRDRMRALFVDGGRRACFVQNSIVNNIAMIDSSARKDHFTPVLTNVKNIISSGSHNITGKLITWTPVTDTAEHYVVRLRPLGATSWKTLKSRDANIAIHDMKPEKIYEVTVSTVLKNGTASANSVPYLFKFTSKK